MTETVSLGAMFIIGILINLVFFYARDAWIKKCEDDIKLRREVENLNRELEYKKKHIESVTERNRNSLLGITVITRSNEDEPLLIGKLTGFQFLTQAKNPAPIIEVDDKKFITLGIVVPYTDEFYLKIEQMTPKEQWDYMVENRLGLRWE